MNSTGKSARKRYGTRHAAKAAKGARPRRKKFGQLPVSARKGNTEQFIRAHGGDVPENTAAEIAYQIEKSVVI